MSNPHGRAQTPAPAAGSSAAGSSAAVSSATGSSATGSDPATTSVMSCSPPFHDHSVLSQYPSRNRIATARQGAFLPQSRRRPTADPALCNELLRRRGPSQMRQRSNAPGPLDVRHGWPGRANTAARGDGPTWGPRAHHLRPQAMKSVVSHCDSISESLLSANHFGFFKDARRRPAAGGYPNRLWARTRTLVAAAAVAGRALPGPRNTAANTGVCSVGEPSTFTRFVGRSGVSSVIAARAG